LEVLILKLVSAGLVGDPIPGERRRGKGGAHGLAPGIRAEGVGVFVLGVLDSLKQDLAEIGESGGGFGFDLTFCDGGEKAGQGGAEIAGGEITAGKERGYITAGTSRSAALAAVGEGESTQARTVFLILDRRAVFILRDCKAVDGAIGGHGSLQKRRV